MWKNPIFQERKKNPEKTLFFRREKKMSKTLFFRREKKMYKKPYFSGDSLSKKNVEKTLVTKGLRTIFYRSFIGKKNVEKTAKYFSKTFN